MKITTNILLISIALIFFGCQDILGPQLQDTSIVQTETKWRVSPINNSKISKISFTEYNRKGEIIRETNYNNSGDLKSISEFSFNSGIRVEREVSFSNGDTSSVLVYNYMIENGAVTEKITLDTSGSVLRNEEIEYDNRGNVIKRLIKTSNGNSKIITYHNSYTNGSLIAQYTFEDGGTVTQKDSIIYGADDNYFEKITTDNKGVVYFTTGYTINDKGNLTSETLKDSKGLIIEKYIYEFTYFE